MKEEIIYSVPLNEVAQRIDMSVSFVRLAVKLGKFKSKKVGQLYLVPQSDIDTFNENPFQITQLEAVFAARKASE